METKLVKAAVCPVPELKAPKPGGNADKNLKFSFHKIFHSVFVFSQNGFCQSFNVRWGTSRMPWGITLPGIS
jgi:hypothetical protein